MNNEDRELGIVDLNPKPGADNQQEPLEKEILICFRPFVEGAKVSRDLRFPPNRIDDTTSKYVSGNDDSNALSIETQDQSSNSRSQDSCPLKKRAHEDQDSELKEAPKKLCIEGKREPQDKSGDEQQKKTT
jgi:hypothetical protein